jgi:PIN domain nuclease of toxin-antitoxin system
MEVLLDTQAFIYAVHPEHVHRLPAKARHAIETADRRYLSVVSVYENAVKHAKGKLEMDRKLVEKLIADLVVDLLPVNPEHVFNGFDLPMYHTDPFDRLIIITALEQTLPLIGGDEQFRWYKSLKVIWR